MQTPTAADVLLWTPPTYDFGDYGYDADTLAQPVAEAAATFTKITGLEFSAVAAADEPLVQKAVRGLTQLSVAQAQADYAETLADFDLLQSFSAGSYSETRRSPDDARKARMIVAWPWLNSLLWDLMTEDRYDYWVSFFGGQNAPAANYLEVDWMGKEVPLSDGSPLPPEAPSIYGQGIGGD